MRSLGLAVVLLCALLSACRGEGTTDRSAPTPTVTAAPDRPQCRLLSPAERAELAGVRVDVEQPPGTGDLPSCSWVSTSDTDDTVLVQVTRTSASAWARWFPTYVASLRRTSPQIYERDRPRLDRFARATSDRSLTPTQACDVYTALNAGDRGAESGVHLGDSESDGVRLLTAQTCQDGTYTAVTLGRRGLSDDAAVEDRLRDALEVVRTAR